MALTAADIGLIMAALIRPHTLAATFRIADQAELSQPFTVFHSDFSAFPTEIMGLMTAALISDQTTPATALMPFQMAVKNAAIPFHTAWTMAVIWVWKWFQRPISRASGSAKITRSSGHHFRKNPAIAFQTLDVVLEMLFQIPTTACHSQVTPVTSPFHTAWRPCHRAMAPCLTP